ncbi:MAG: hypothetical protein R6V19_15015 [Armatimonadota bacterium]
MKQGLLTWTTVAICLVASLQMVGRISYSQAPSYPEDEIKADLTTWQLWKDKVPVPSKPTMENVHLYTPEAYRLLSALVSLLVSLSPCPHIIFWALLLLLIWGSWVLLFFFSQKWLSPTGALIVVLCAIVVTSGPHYPPLIARGLEMFLAMILTFSCLWALSEERSGILAILFPLALLNREDALIIGAVAGIWWLLNRRVSSRLYIAIGSILVFAAIRAISISIIGVRPYYCDLFTGIIRNIDTFKYILQSGNLFHPVVSFGTTFIPLGLIALVKVRELPPFLKAATLTCAAYMVTWIIFARMEEPYHWLILLPLFIIPAIYILVPDLRRDKQPQTRDGRQG